MKANNNNSDLKIKIRKEYLKINGNISYLELAKKFKTSESFVSVALRNIFRKHRV